MTAPEYPKRPKFFASKFCRLLTKTAAAQVIGADACWLLSVIVHQEDSARYRPVTFWNGQLQPLCGCKSDKTLFRVRKRAVDAGWLHYQPGGKTRAGVYWVTIPERYTKLGDGPIDEGLPPVLTGDSDGTSGGQSDVSTADFYDVSGSQRAAQVEVKGRRKGVTSLPNPYPSPDPCPKRARAAFLKPTLEEVTAYCLERNKGINPEHFLDFYESNGWKVGKNPMKDWKAAVRTWERNGVQRGGKQQLNLDSTDQWLKDKEAESHGSHDAR